MTRLDMYVCDNCESYLQAKKAYTLLITLEPADDNSEPAPLIDVYQLERHVCRTCGETLVKDFKLELEEDDLIAKFAEVKP